MFRPNWRRVVVAAIILGTIAIAETPAEGCWGWGCCRPLYGGCCAYYPSCCSYSFCCYPGGWYGCCCSSWYCWPCGDSGYAVISDTCCAAEAQRPVTKPTPAPEQPEEPTAPAPEAEPAPLVPRAAPLVPEPEPAQPEPAAPEATQPQTGEMPAVPSILTEPEEPEKATKPAPAAGHSTSGRSPLPEQSGVLSLSVPPHARVIINGLVTKSTGAHREYVSHGMKPGCVYKYEIRAQIVRDGRLIEDTSTVYLAAGAHKAVAFRFGPKPDEAVATLW